MDNQKTPAKNSKQSTKTAMLLAFVAIVLGLIIRGGFGDMLVFLGIIFFLVGIVTIFQNRKLKKKNKS